MTKDGAMKEAFGGEKYYSAEQDFGGVCVRNYRQVMQHYNYSRYLVRFRALADSRRLAAQQRPKLQPQEFDSLMEKLNDALAKVGEARLMDDPKNQRTAARLLVATLFDVDDGV